MRDHRFITLRRGGTLGDSDHHLLAVWAADCAQHALPLFEAKQPNDDRPRHAIELARAWARGTLTGVVTALLLPVVIWLATWLLEKVLGGS